MAASELVAKLLEKAAQDELVLDTVMGEPDISTETLGFHAQQAVEKLLKAALAHAGVAYPFTHRIEELLDVATDNNVVLPSFCEELRHLTPFAVQYRYEVLDEDLEEPIDLGAVRQRIRELREWVRAFAAVSQEEDPAQ